MLQYSEAEYSALLFFSEATRVRGGKGHRLFRRADNECAVEDKAIGEDTAEDTGQNHAAIRDGVSSPGKYWLVFLGFFF